MGNGLLRPDCRLCRFLLVVVLCAVTTLPASAPAFQFASPAAGNEERPEEPNDFEKAVDDCLLHIRTSRTVRPGPASTFINHPRSDSPSLCPPSPFASFLARRDNGLPSRLRC